MRRTALILPLVLAACGSATAPATMLRLEVAAPVVSCFGFVPQDCLLVRERADGEYQLFYSGIEGFTHEEGYEYTLDVKRTRIKNPPADGSSLRYQLVSVRSRSRSPHADAIRALRSAQALWHSRHTAGPYSLVIRRDCECLPAASGPVRIDVSASLHPVRFTYIADGTTVPTTMQPLFLTIEQLFAQAAWEIAMGAAEVDLEFHPTLGYPLRLAVDRDAHTADDEYTYVVLEVTFQ